MRLLAAAVAFVTLSASAGMPAHLKRLPAGAVYRGPAPAALGGAREGDRTPLWLPGGERSFEVERVVRGRDATTRFGRIPGVGAATITLGPDGGFGQVVQGHTLWLLEYRDGEAFAIPAGKGGLALAPVDDGARLPSGLEPVIPKGAPGGTWTRPTVTVDFAGLYDNDFAARYPGTLAATRIEFLVALANQAFVDSDVGITLRTVHTQLAPGEVHPSALYNVYHLYQATTAGTFANVDVRAMRRAYGADLVTFFRAHELYEREVCGVAYFPYDYTTSVNVVMDGESGGSVCTPKVFAHEVGHNFGARHQRAVDSTPADGHAFHRPGQFHTIMASLGSGKPDRFLTLNYFSNPRIACGNLPCGTEPETLSCINPPCPTTGEDNAGVMNRHAAQIAGYFPSRLLAEAPRPAPTLADSDGDGLIDRIDAFPFDAARTVDTDGDGHADPDDAFPDNSTEWVDSDGGGQGDNADADNDNDGVADGSDKFPLDPLESADADNDGHGDAGDAFDADPREQRDTDGDGLGDRIADDDDDADGLVDVAPLTTAADAELLVADAATNRILRFQGSDYAPLGTLLQLGTSDVTFRSGMAGAPGGELYFVARNHFHSLDRLRATTAELMLDPGAHPQIGTGFPLSPVVLTSGDVMLGEAGTGYWLAMRPAPWRAAAARPLGIRSMFGDPSMPFLSLGDPGHYFVLDSGRPDSAAAAWYSYGADPVASGGTFENYVAPVAPGFATGDTAQRSNALLYWVDRRDGAVRSLDPVTGVDGGFVLPNADAAAIDVSPDGVLVVARRSGGVRAYDADDGADLGLVIPASSAAQPLQIAWVPRIVDTDMPPIVPPTPPSPTADPATTPAVDSSRPPPPPCTTDCIKVRDEGSGGALDPRFALLLAMLLLGGRLTRNRRPV